MAITAKPSRKAATAQGVDIDALISKGGSVAAPGAEQGNGNYKTDKDGNAKVLARVPADILEDVDTQIRTRRPRISRNSWIVAAIMEKLDRDKGEQAAK